MYKLFSIKLLIIILTMCISNNNINPIEDYLNNVDKSYINELDNFKLNQRTEDSLNENSNNIDDNTSDTDIHTNWNNSIMQYTSDNWDDTSNESYFAKYYRTNVDKNSTTEDNNFNLKKYTNKIWISKSNSDFSFTITDIKYNIIKGIISTDGIISLPCYNYTENLKERNNSDFIGIIQDGKAICEFGYDKYGNIGKIELSFVGDTTIKANINFIYKQEYTKITDGEYYFKPYYRQLKDISSLDGTPLTEEKHFTVELNSWGFVNITTGYVLEKHPYAVAYITNNNREILYEFYYFINGIKIEDIIVEDINNDGLKDVSILFDICKDEPLRSNFIQLKNGLFVKQ